ncbi:MAG: ABC transporter permease, partial [Anaerolineae bacterium]|nr:ABC transporter permease [Anaerolineae bacterium]
TILALSAGMFALSSITFVGEGTRELLNIQLSRSFGGNVLVFPFPGLPSSMIKGAIDDALQDLEIDYRTTIDNFSSQITHLNGAAIDGDGALEIAVWRSDKPDIYSGQPAVSSGRMLTPDDAGQPRIVLPMVVAAALEIEVGDSLQIDSAAGIALEVVGITGEAEGMASFGEPSALLPP